MKPQLTKFYLTASERRTTLLFLYVVVMLLAALAFAPIADAGRGRNG